MKKWLLFLVKLLLTAGCLVWAMRGIEWRDSVLARPDELAWDWILIGLGFAGLTVSLSALRLWLLLRAQGVRIGLGRAHELTLIGNLFNLVAVGGIGGDAARIYLLIRDFPGRKLAITMTVMFDHLVGLVAMSLVFFLLTAGRFDDLASQSVETRAILRFAWAFFAGGLALVALMFVVSYPPVHRRIHDRGGEWRLAFLRRLPEVYDLFRREWKLAVVALVVAVLMLPVYYASFWAAARAAGDQVAAAPMLVAMPVVDMLSALPLSVAGLGVREASMKVLMQDLTGMNAQVAVSASLIGFAMSLVWALAGGLLFLRPRDRVSVRELEQVAQDS